MDTAPATVVLQAPPKPQPVAGPLHTIIVLLVIASWAVLGYYSAGRARTMEIHNKIPLYLPTIIWEWLVVGLIYLGIRRRGKSLRDLIGGRWDSAQAFFIDWGTSIIFWISALVVLGTVSQGLHMGKTTKSVEFMLPHTLPEIGVWLLLSITAGVCEETIFRGYLQKQFIAWTNVPIGVVLTAAGFGAAHIYQGGRLTIMIGVYGLLLGILAQMRNSLRPGIIAHAWQDSFSGIMGPILLRILQKHGQM